MAASVVILGRLGAVSADSTKMGGGAEGGDRWVLKFRYQGPNGIEST